MKRKDNRLLITAVKLQLPSDLHSEEKQIEISVYPHSPRFLVRPPGSNQSSFITLRNKETSCLFMIRVPRFEGCTIHVSALVDNPTLYAGPFPSPDARYLGYISREIHPGPDVIQLDLTIDKFEPYVLYRAAASF